MILPTTNPALLATSLALLVGYAAAQTSPPNNSDFDDDFNRSSRLATGAIVGIVIAIVVIIIIKIIILIFVLRWLRRRRDAHRAVVAQGGYPSAGYQYNGQNQYRNQYGGGYAPQHWRRTQQTYDDSANEYGQQPPSYGNDYAKSATPNVKEGV